MIQAIKYKCCDSYLAVCKEPYCYTDEDWLADLRNYVNKGHKVEMIEQIDEKFGCKCKEKENLFSETGELK